MRLLPSLLAGLTVLTLTATASAYGDGASGYTGKQEGRSCNSCHSGGTAPAVTITGPDSLAPGATGDYTLVISTTQAKGAGGVAASDGTLAAGTGLHDEGGELTHDKAISASGGKASFSFKVTAPESGSTLRLFAVGLASNGSGKSGDKATQITKDITITGGDTTPTTPTTPTKPAEEADQATSDGAATSTDATEPSSSKTSKKKKASSGDDDDDDDSSTTRRDPFAGNTSTACTMHHGKADPVGLGAALGVVLGLALLGRRRR